MKATIIHIEGEGSEAALRSALDLLKGVIPGVTVSPAFPRPQPTGPTAPMPVRTPPPPPAVDRSTPPPPVPTSRKCERLLEHCPTSMAELPKFFELLNDEQLDACWVACLIDCAVGSSGRVDISQLAAACNAVRARYRAAAIDRPPDAPPADLKPPPPPEPTPEPDHHPAPDPAQTPVRHWPQLQADLLAALPEVGDEVMVSAFAATESERSTLKHHTHKGRSDDRVEWMPGKPGGKPPAKIRRVKA